MLKKIALLFLVLSALALIPSGAQEQKPAAHTWTYGGKAGPTHWGQISPEFATCKLGHEQSPIDIHGAKSMDLPPILFDYHSSPLKIINNGHTIQLNYAPGSAITVGDHRYELRQFHFHHPSEEKIKGKPSDMVAHLVHADTDGNLAVVAVLLDKGSANALIQSLWDHLPKQEGKEDVVENLQINAADLLPAERGYFTFKGSLTTPPCSENVTWFVLKAFGQISEAEINTFTRVYPHNARPTQPLNGRTVTETK